MPGCFTRFFFFYIQYPLLLLPVFPRLHELSQTALARSDLSAVESVTLQEALLLISNHFCCYERQSALVAEVSSPPLLEMYFLDLKAFLFIPFFSTK